MQIARLSDVLTVRSLGEMNRSLASARVFGGCCVRFLSTTASTCIPGRQHKRRGTSLPYLNPGALAGAAGALSIDHDATVSFTQADNYGF